MRGYTGSQEAAKWSLSGARPVLEVLGWSPVIQEGLYIIIQAVSKLLNGTLVVEWGPGVLERSPAPHDGLDTLYKETYSPGADCCSIAPLRLHGKAAQWSLSGARWFSGWSLVTMDNH